ncbi:MAG: dipeptide/oligopeptide/nickel ABC transporter permease/ATP-binding protein [Bifidobacteriaceae bacterium]|jgi:oligopeptide/dipeptide ABC transporter ATP-binding protein|nr:dipeptide/oligopeptide/nickel ABC transporter permease/ATP-binding protein [Bifidobacteriaceae bacterium]
MRQAFRSPLGLAAQVLLGLVVLGAVAGPLVWGQAAEANDTANILAPPTAAHPLGTDNLGRDLLARTLAATGLTVALALGATGVAVALGLLLGTAPILLGRRARGLVAGFVNIAVAFPGLLLALFFATIFGVGATGAVFAIGLAGAPTMARLIQTLVAGIEQRDFVAAARIAGLGRGRILRRHILPNIAEPLIVQATIGAGSVLLSFAGLSFLGLGVQPPAYDWGRLMNEGLNRIYINPLAALAPGVAVVVAGLAFNLTGETLAQALRVGTGLGAFAPPDAVRPPPPAAPPAAASKAPAADAVLRVRGLTVAFGPAQPVKGVSFEVAAGEAVGIVGESGAGKSLTGLALAGLVEPASAVGGEVVFLGAKLGGAGQRAAGQRKLLGTSMALVFQDPVSAFNPARRVGEQLAELGRAHLGLGRRAAWARAVDRLGAVRIPDAARRARQHPHQFSGGMLQRAMIGLGLMGRPALLIADEPTTALDVTAQRRVLDLIGQVRRDHGAALLLISHDVTVVAERCDRLLVMYAGRVVEELPAAALGSAAHPYTRLLLAAAPSLETDLDRPLAVIPGRQPSPREAVGGCAFARWCPLALDRCRAERPELAAAGAAAGGRVACWRPGQALPRPGQTEAALGQGGPPGPPGADGQASPRLAGGAADGLAGP